MVLLLMPILDTVPMVPILMLVLMAATTLARGLLMLSPRLMLMPTMDPVDTLDTVHMLVTHTLMEPTLPMVLIPIWDKKEASIPCSMKNLNFPQKLSIQRKPQQDKKQYDCHQVLPHIQCQLSSAAL